MNFDERVDQGMALLDEKVPGWVDMIDLDELDMRTGEKCICGQTIHPNFVTAVGLLGLDYLNLEDEKYGLSTRQCNYPALQKVWVRKIKERRGQ